MMALIVGTVAGLNLAGVGPWPLVGGGVMTKAVYWWLLSAAVLSGSHQVGAAVVSR